MLFLIIQSSLIVQLFPSSHFERGVHFSLDGVFSATLFCSFINVLIPGWFFSNFFLKFSFCLEAWLKKEIHSKKKKGEKTNRHYEFRLIIYVVQVHCMYNIIGLVYPESYNIIFEGRKREKGKSNSFSPDINRTVSVLYPNICLLSTIYYIYLYLFLFCTPYLSH